MEKARILVVDDDATFLALMKDFLEDEGYSVSVLEGVGKAYRQIKKSLPDLVILDLRLEEPDAGWKVLDKLKFNSQTAQIPVVVCSADIRALREESGRLQSLGITAIEKPFDLDALQAAIRQALSA